MLVQPSASAPKSLCLALHVKWNAPSGRSRMHNLTLRRVQDVHGLEGLPEDLVRRAFPGKLPPHLTSCQQHYHFTPQEECLSLPNDVSCTHFRLVATFDGWEYCVYERTLLTAEQDDAQRPMLVTVIEFESTAMVIGQLGIRIQLVAYPVVSIKRSFLDDIDYRLRTDPAFKGIM